MTNRYHICQCILWVGQGLKTNLVLVESLFEMRVLACEDSTTRTLKFSKQTVKTIDFIVQIAYYRLVKGMRQFFAASRTLGRLAQLARAQH